MPFTPGGEISGTIHEAGEGVGLRPGQRLIATPPLPRGGYAERVAVPASSVFPIPESMPFEKAVAKNYSVVGMHRGLYTRVMPDLIRGTHEALIRLYKDGEIDPLISGTVPFEELPKALELLGGRGTHGKVIARPSG